MPDELLLLESELGFSMMIRRVERSERERMPGRGAMLMESDKTNIIVIDMCPKFSGMFIIRQLLKPLRRSTLDAFELHKHKAFAHHTAVPFSDQPSHL